MNCQNCKNYVFGRCLVTNFLVGPDVCCNAWEPSQSHEFVETAFASFSPDELQKQVAELEQGIEIMKLEINKSHGCISDLRQLLTDLESQLCWIPVNERLPELDQDVFAIVEGDIDKGHFYQQFDGEIYFSSDVNGAMLVATHWMAVPDLPEEVQE